MMMMMIEKWKWLNTGTPARNEYRHACTHCAHCSGTALASHDWNFG